METHVRADATAPAFVSDASQPASSSPFDGTNRDAGGIQDLVQLFGLARSKRGELASDLFDQLSASVLTSDTLAMVRKRRKGDFHMTLCEAIKGPFAGESSPLSEQRQGDEFTQAQLGSWSRVLGHRQTVLLAQIIDHRQTVLLAQIIDHDGEYRQKGVQIFHCQLLERY
jgi:hypothetical protein